MHMGCLSEYFDLCAGLTMLQGYQLYILLALLVFLLLVAAVLAIRIKKNKSQSAPPCSNEDPITSILIASAQLNKSSRSILLAANGVNDLPATIPINLAIRLAEKSKCLMIDLDLRRDAMAAVFEIDSSRMTRNLKLEPVPTTLDNLDIWPARYFDLLKQMNLRLLLKKANHKYDFILLYAPYLSSLPDRNQIVYCSKQAVLFSGKQNNSDLLKRLLDRNDCRLLCHC